MSDNLRTIVIDGEEIDVPAEYNLLQASEFGQMSAFSIVYFLIILLLSWLFYTVINNMGKGT